MAVDFPYPYDATDGREDPDPGDEICFALRGGAYSQSAESSYAFRRRASVGLSVARNVGFRLVCEA